MSYCDCDYDAPEFHSRETRKARKQHTCCECGGPIAAAETYECVTGKWEGCLLYFKTCSLCLELREWARISMPCFCHSYEGLHESVVEMVDDIKGKVPGIVFEWGRRIIKIRRKRYGRHWPQRGIQIAEAARLADVRERQRQERERTNPAQEARA